MRRSLIAARVILGLVLVAVGFLALVIFLEFVLPFQPDVLTMWVWIMPAISMLGAGVGIFSGFSIRETLAGVIFGLLGSIVFFVPLPANVGELVWVLWLFFLVCLLWGYNKYKKRNKNPAKNTLTNQ